MVLVGRVHDSNRKLNFSLNKILGIETVKVD